MTDVWTVNRVERLKKLWTEGLSCAQIANELCAGISRNAVIGKVTRLKLPPRGGRASTMPQTPAPMATRKPGKISSLPMIPQGRRNQANSLAEKIAIAEAEPGIPPRLRGEKPDGTGIKFIDLTSLNCHWPKGDPLEEDFEFCGAGAIPGMPYCAHHCRMSYAPAADRRRVANPA